ncbi:class I SAM-dependent methyltransferase [Lutimonas halocynthiae]|uniref:class I SAM-dependent methyltransferase n=1 Tax=Lutimonas halocynthiae TaxID=1446477 RepID=UPI0025B30002|nr:class I SAM-dependent methyltransferase [Lutimonas halocynthiae]MDN3642418.1 class I SAM-dependent methyltransferase [Lutimonas halocynthiae]
MNEFLTKKNYWDTIYQEKPTIELGWFQEVPAMSLDLIKSSGIKIDAKIIDIGGGDSLLVDHLLELGYLNITVLDLSKSAIERAKSRLGSKGSNVNWICSDIRDFNTDEKFDLWHDRACFHFLIDNADIQIYASKLNQFLAEKGTVVLGTFSKTGPKKCSGLPIKQYDSKTITQIFTQDFHLEKNMEATHITPSLARQNYVFCRLKRIT